MPKREMIAVRFQASASSLSSLRREFLAAAALGSALATESSPIDDSADVATRDDCSPSLPTMCGLPNGGGPRSVMSSGFNVGCSENQAHLPFRAASAT